MKTLVRRSVATTAVCFAFFTLARDCGAQQMLCNAGYASLQSRFDTGVTVDVGPVKSSGLAQRSCSASLEWGSDKLVAVKQAAQVDVDLLGADLGLNVPVVAFEVKQATSDSLADYDIYSLEKPPRLLRRLHGARQYSAADVALDGRVAIWTDDAEAFDGIDGLDKVDSPPMAVLRFEQGKLVDAGAEFQPQFDARIKQLRSEIDPGSARAFKQTDGRLAAPTLSAGDLKFVLEVKTRVLQIAWLYLSSGREAEAWATLAEDWPASDLDRIRGEIVARKSRGIRTQVDGISTKIPKPGSLQKIQVYDSVHVNKLPHGIRLQMQREDSENGPQPAPEQKEWLELVVDSAGKVRTASMIEPYHDSELLEATREWKFVPAFAGSHPVACRFRMFVAPYR